MKIKSANKRLQALKSDRSGFIELWRTLSDYHLGHRGRFLRSESKKKKPITSTSQYNNTSRLASRTLAAGMQAGITSPARPWFRLAPSSPALREVKSVKLWLKSVEDTMYRVFSQSNTYNALHTLYTELGVFGTGAMGVYKDFDNVIRCKTYTAGSYMLAMNGVDVVDTMYREYQLTVGECVKQFGKDNCSDDVQRQWNEGNTEALIDVVHVVEPNDDRDKLSPLAKDKRFRSCYYEVGASAKDSDKFLRESGFDVFPILAPRWDVVDGEVYSLDSPGIVALGDTKALQLYEKRKAQSIEKVANPQLQGPANIVNEYKKSGPNDAIASGANGNEKLEPIYGPSYNPRINEVRQEIAENETRVKRAFYEDLFLMLANTDRRQMTAREVAEKHEEKLLMLGPVLERLHNELLDPLIERTFAILQEEGVFPPAPPELEQNGLEVEYVSVLAQAQRMVAVTGIERMIGFAGEAAAAWPEALMKIDIERAIDDYAESVGTDPAIVRSSEEVKQLIEAQRQQQAQQQAMQQAGEMANTAKTLSETDTSGENALHDMLSAAGLQ